MDASEEPLLDGWLDHVSGCFTQETARALVELPPHEAVRRRMSELGEKASSGILTSDEAREYETYIEVGDLIAALQLKARKQLAAAA
jgi:hypothetical protein